MDIPGILIPIGFIAISGHFIWRSTNSFEIAADYLGRKMSKGAKGASINAVASSMPEFLTTLFFLFFVRDEGVFIDSFSGGLGVVAGSAVFNILIIPIAVIIFGTAAFSKNSFKLDKSVLLRDGLFLILSNAVFLLVIAKQIITPVHGGILVAIYLVYLLFLVRKFGLGSTMENEAVYRIPELKGKARYNVFWYPVLVFFQGKELTKKNAWLLLLFSTVVMSAGTLLLVKGTEWLGSKTYTLPLIARELEGLNLPIILLSVLFAAAATSIPDTMISVRDARKGNHDDSISNAIGSNIFDLSFALGLPILLYTIFYGNIEMSEHVRTLSITYWLLMWVITILVISIFLIARKISKRIGFILIVLYLAFVVMIFEEANSKLLGELANSIISLVN